MDGSDIMSERIIALIVVCIFLLLVGCIITVVIIKPSRLQVKAKIHNSEVSIDLDNSKRS